jgi:hypothetical protein
MMDGGTSVVGCEGCKALRISSSLMVASSSSLELDSDSLNKIENQVINKKNSTQTFEFLLSILEPDVF